MDIVKTIADIAHLHSSSKQEAVELLSRAIIEVSSRGGGSVGETTTKPIEQSVAQTPKPQAPEPKKQILVREGHICSNRAGVDLYRVNKDIPDGLTTEEFAKCFSPLRADVPAFPVDFNIEHDQWGCRVDDPTTGEGLGLLLWGTWPREGGGISLSGGKTYSGGGPDLSRDGSVGSIGEGDL